MASTYEKADKVVFQTEYYQLPAPIFSIVNEKFTKSTLFAHKNFKDMDKQDRIRACYLHACLKYVRGEFMTNSSLRERFKIESENSAIISRIIKDTISANLVKCYDISTGSKSRKYMPFWA